MIKGSFLTALVVGAVIASGSLYSGSQVDEIQYVGSGLWTRAFDLTVKDGYAYCSFLNGLGVLDVTDKANPRLVSKLFLGGGFGIDVHENHAFVAAGSKGLQIVDVSDPLSPQVTGVLPTPGEAKDLVVRDGFAFIADGPTGLLIADISDPRQPVVAGSLDTPGSAEAIVLDGGFAFIADASGGLQVIEVSDPSSPALAGTFDTPDIAEEVAVSGNHAYVASGSSGLQVIDISDPSSPDLESSFPTGGYAKGIAIRGNTAYVGGLYDALFKVIDISDPASLSERAELQYTWPNESWDVSIEGELAFIVDYFSGIFVVDIRDDESPQLVGEYRTASFLVGIEVSRDRVYTLGQERFGLATLDMADPANPVFLGNSNPGLRFGQGVAVRGQRAYVSSPGLNVLAVNDPWDDDSVITRLVLPGVARAVSLRGDFAYLTSDNSGFHIVDISDESSPTIAGSVEMPGSTYGLALSGDQAYLANSEFGLKIIDITNPSTPTLTTSLKTPGNAYDVKVEGDYAYIADGEAGLQVVDIADPESPSITGSLALGGFINSIAIMGEFAYVTDEDFGVRKIDISEPTSPVLVASFDTPGEPTDVRTYGDYVIVNDAFSIIVLR
jgi:hypothetical protein